MRKLTLLLVVSLLVFMLPSTFAQEEELPTIADLVLQQVDADPAEFTVLMSALEAADPSVMEMFTTPTDYNGWTVFAPTDAAFESTFAALGLPAEDVLANQNLLNLVLAYHVVPMTLTSDVLTGAAGEYYVGTLLPDHPLKITSNDDGTFLVNDVAVVSSDVLASNGVVHVIDGVLVPEGLMEMVAAMASETETDLGTDTVADLTAADENLSTLVSAIGEIAETHPEVVDLVSDPAVQVTIFAPTNDAFGTLSEESLNAVQANTDLLAVLLGYHVLPGIFTADGLTVLGNSIEGGAFDVMTAAGLPVTVTVSDEGINVGGAMVTGTDVLAANGIIHTIDTVILLPVE